MLKVDVLQENFYGVNGSWELKFLTGFAFWVKFLMLADLTVLTMYYKESG